MSGETPKALVKAVKDSVKTVKLRIRPKAIPKGRILPCVVPADRIAGSMGRMQGDRTVKMPAKNAKKRSIAIEDPAVRVSCRLRVIIIFVKVPPKFYLRGAETRR